MLTEENVEIARQKGFVLAQQERNIVHGQFQCNHLKGGYIGLDGKMPLKGNSPQYAVLKHQMMNGDIWVRCLRCGKWWKPPVRSQYKIDKDYWKAMFEYEAAVDFPTNNTTSGSILCKFTRSDFDATEEVRQKMVELSGAY